MKQRLLLELAGIPVYQNRIFETREDAVACPRGDLMLVQDDATGLIFNSAFDAQLIEYSDDYQNEQAHSETFRTHLEQAYAVIQRNLAGRALAEVGCGKGFFLELLRSRGFSAVGVDPAYQGDRPYVIKRPFDRSLGVKADAIVLRHVLEHIPGPLGFLQELAESNGGGYIYIEVPCFDWICRRRAWFDLFYEHVNYFRLADLRRMFGRVADAGRLFGDQYLFVVADLATLRKPQSMLPGDEVRFPADFFSGIEACARLSDSGRRHVVWGAGAKGVMFSAHVLKNGGHIDFAIDINPAKHDKFLAASGIPVLDPERGIQKLAAGDTIFIMNSVYAHEIKARAGARFNYITVER